MIKYLALLSFLCSITVALEASCAARPSQAEFSCDEVSLLQLRHQVKSVLDLRQAPGVTSIEAAKPPNSSNETNTTHNVGNFWSGIKGNLAQTGASPYAVPKDFTGGPTWNFTVGQNEVVGTPLIDSLRNIYLTTIYGKVLKFDVDGSSLWNQSVGANVNVTPAIADGAVHLATEAGEAVSLDMASGNVTWRRKLSNCSGPSARAVMASSGVVVHALHYTDEDCSTRTYINALDAKNGDELWTYSPLDFIGHRGAPAGLFSIEGSFIVFTDIEGNVCQLNLKSGKEIWGHDSQVIVVTESSNVSKEENATILDAQTIDKVNSSFNGSRGAEQEVVEDSLLQEQTSYDVFDSAKSGSGAVVGPGQVVFVASNPALDAKPGTRDHGKRAGRLEALNFTTGKLLWQVNLARTISTSPVVGQLHPGGKGHLSVLITVGNSSALASTDDGMSLTQRLYSGKVLAFEALTGATQNWTYEQQPWSADPECNASLVQAFSNPAIGGDGTVYVGSGNGMLYALRDHDGDGFVNETKRGKEREVTFYAAGHAFIASPAIAPGLLVAAPCNGIVVFKQF